jgi:homopolymeric O-antigen transport system ATP-binding protein
MGEVAIRAQSVAKRYRLGTRERYKTIRESLMGSIRLPFTRRGAGEEAGLWALDDVSFEVQHGEAMGIIGRNGAGKSTLLKILSRITEPTRGEVQVFGRIGSLLEVGTGFHPELTGRENIYLNGAILGMKRAEIARRFDEIVAFSEIERFLDTPAKRYSSGMYMRLAFAVAAHLEPEILVVDEVLAVGDAEFQRKCLGKMSDVARGGRTVLFVSHNMAAVQNLCASAVLLDGGRVAARGPAGEVVARYLAAAPRASDAPEAEIARHPLHDVVLKGVSFSDASGRPLSGLQTGMAGRITLRVLTSRRFGDVTATIGVNSSLDDTRVCLFYSPVSGGRLSLEPPATSLVCEIPKVPFPPGRYRLMLKLAAGGEALFFLPGILDLDVTDGDFYGTGKLPDPGWAGVVLVDHAWRSLAAGK